MLMLVAWSTPIIHNCVSTLWWKQSIGKPILTWILTNHLGDSGINHWPKTMIMQGKIASDWNSIISHFSLLSQCNQVEPVIVMKRTKNSFWRNHKLPIRANVLQDRIVPIMNVNDAPRIMKSCRTSTKNKEMIIYLPSISFLWSEGSYFSYLIQCCKPSTEIFGRYICPIF